MKLNALLAEVLGTFILCFAGIGAIVNQTGSPDLLMVALAHGLAIVVAGTALGAVSGGHFNPAVSLALALAKKISPTTMITYWVAQCIGAIAGTALVRMTYSDIVWETARLGLPTLAGPVNPGAGFALEAIGTAILVLTVFGTAVDGRAPKMGALFIGLSITVMIITFGPLTGCGINPARWLGPAVAMMDFRDALVFVLGPLVGAALAAFLYQGLFAEKKEAAA